MGRLMVYLGIDPGVSGGIAGVTATGELVQAVKMPETPAELCELLEGIAAPLRPFGRRPRCVLELVAAFAPKGQRMGATSAFTFGKGFGRLESALAAAKIPVDLAVPRKWQAAMQCVTHGDKNISKARALQLFPGFPVTHATADAMLIAEYCRRMYVGSVHQQAEGSTNGKAQSTETGKGASRTEASSEGRTEEKGRRKEGSRRSQSGAPRHGAGPRP